MTETTPSNNASPVSASTGVYSQTDELLRLRAVAQGLTLTTRRKSSALMEGSQHTAFRGRGMEFAEVRPYQSGDDIRSIDWRVTARTQKPHTKLFQEERERPVFVMVDMRSPMFFGSQHQFKSVFATELASVIGWAAQANNDRVGALLFGDTDQHDIRARRGKHAVLELIHQLLRHNHALRSPIPAANGQALEIMLGDLRRVVKPGSSVFVLSDFHDFSHACREPLAMLRKHCDTTLVHIYDPLEKALPERGLLPVTDGHHKRFLNAGSAQVRNRFRKSFDERVELMRELCQSAAMPLVDAVISQRAETLALTLFNPRAQSRHRIVKGPAHVQ